MCSIHSNVSLLDSSAEPIDSTEYSFVEIVKHMKIVVDENGQLYLAL